MSARDRAIAAQPDFPWLDLDRPDDVRRFMIERGWLGPDETPFACERAGAGNMNLTLRIRAAGRTLILKQARPWVEKYDHIEAPWDRIAVEHRFYRRVGDIEVLRDRMPEVLAFDADARTMLLADLGAGEDMTSVYAGDAITHDDARSFGGFLRQLHAETRGIDTATFANREMRALNHAHIFELPLSGELDLPLDDYEPGLADAARALQQDADFVAVVRDLGQRYLADGPCLVHGDYFPGSWFSVDGRLYVLDPEFAFCGDPEFDVGVAMAHFALAHRAPDVAWTFLEAAGADLDRELAARFAATEVMRRLIGVAQLPIPATRGTRAAMLQWSRRVAGSGDLEAWPLGDA